MRYGLFFLATLIISGLASPGAMRAESDLPINYKYVIMQALRADHPGWDLIDITTSADTTQIVDACGRLYNGRRAVPFYLMVFPGEPPRAMPVVTGINDNLDRQVRSICAERGLSFD